MFFITPSNLSTPPSPQPAPSPKTPTHQGCIGNLQKTRKRRSSIQGPFTSSADFRHALINGTTLRSGPIPIMDVNGKRRRFYEIPMDGNCGFSAVARGLVALGILSGTEANSQGVRRRVMQHVQEEEWFYAEKVAEWYMWENEGCSEDEAWGVGVGSVERFVRVVGREGMNGHWLGGMWGELEFVAVCRTFGVNVEVFTYCTLKQGVVRYRDHNVGAVGTVSVLFTGIARRGHFDLLLPEMAVLEKVGRWSRRVRRGLAGR